MIKRLIGLASGLLFLFVLSCGPKVIRPVRFEEAYQVCSMATPEFPITGRVGVRFEEGGERKASVAGLIDIKDRQTFKVALLGPFGSQVGEVYFHRGRVVAYKEGKKVLETSIPIRGFPEVKSLFRDANLLRKDHLVVLKTEIDSAVLTCNIKSEEMAFQDFVIEKGNSKMVLEGYRDGFYKRIIITQGKRQITISVRQIQPKR